MAQTWLRGVSGADYLTIAHTAVVVGVVRQLVTVFFLLLCTGCAHYSVVSFEPKELRQDQNQCGAYALSQILQHAGFDVSQSQVAQHVFNPKQQASSSLDMLLYANELGADATLEISDWQSLEMLISQGIPVLVSLDVGLTANHYVVVYGVNDQGVLINDGYKNKRVMTKDEFNRQWRDAGYLAMWVLENEV